jgi:small nuclear ribonucleoprotein (snRNP)-like protein
MLNCRGLGKRIEVFTINGVKYRGTVVGIDMHTQCLALQDVQCLDLKKNFELLIIRMRDVCDLSVLPESDPAILARGPVRKVCMN